MGSCYGLLPGMAEAATTLSSMATDNGPIKVDATGTKLTVEGGTYTWSDNVIGGTVTNQTTHETTVINNVKISGATITMAGYLAAGSGSDATLTINGSTISGGDENTELFLAGTYTESGDVNNGHLIIEGDSNVGPTESNVGVKGIYGGYTGSGSVSDSSVTISAGTVKLDQSVINIAGGLTGSGTATGNKVNIEGGTITAAGSIESFQKFP